MDIKTDIFNNLKEFISEMEDAEQLASLRLQTSHQTAVAASNSTTLAAFSTARSARGRGRGRGIPQPQPIKRTFCKTCYDNEKGKYTFLSQYE